MEKHIKRLARLEEALQAERKVLKAVLDKGASNTIAVMASSRLRTVEVSLLNVQEALEDYMFTATVEIEVTK